MEQGKAFEVMLALVRNELWQEPFLCQVAPDEASEVMRCAREQAVAGLVANAIIRNSLPIGDERTMEVVAAKQQHERKSRDMNREVSKFAAFLNNRNLDYVVIKGATMAALYPDPLARSCGDIDFYCPKASFPVVQQTIEERLGIVMHHNWSKKHDNFLIEGFSFEMHSDITDFGYFGHQRYWDSFIDGELRAEPFAVEIDGVNVKTLSPTLNALYIFVHAFYHLVLNGNGMGLKQFCDWAMVLRRYHGEVDTDRLRRHLDGIGLRKAFQAVSAFVVSVLGMPEEYLLFPLSEEDRAWADKMMANLLKMREYQNRQHRKHGVSLMHSLGTANVVARQSMMYFRLAPLELFLRLPEMLHWSIKKRLIK